MPHLADELGDWILEHHGKEVDLYVLENGSDRDKQSKHANIIFEESLGPAGGVNAVLRLLLKQDYKYFWINYNDARFYAPGFVTKAVEVMEQQSEIGMYVPYWKDNTKTFGVYKRLDLVTYFSILSFVVSRRALEVCAQVDTLRLDPLWDSENFSNHDNILGSLLALYSNRMLAVTDRKYMVFELLTEAEQQSQIARGFTDVAWKQDKGPADMRAWYERTFPELEGSPKQKRAQVLARIENLIRKTRPESVSIHFRMTRYWQRVRKRLRV